MEIDVKALARQLEDAWKPRMKGFSYWNEEFTLPVTVDHRISICTTVMNRLDDLKRTLPKNIKDNADYPFLEFVVLDYNSTDGLLEWMEKEMRGHIQSARVVYYRTDEPEYFDMSHSRNVAFKVAIGDIVNNVDADNFTNPGFATYLNKMANQCVDCKAIFAKSKQLLRGRVGFFKSGFIGLGGYDEDLKGYGHDDADILHRALELGFTMMCFRGPFSGCVSDHKKHQEGNYEKAWWDTEGKNRLMSFANLIAGNWVANNGRKWGKANLIKNFKKYIAV